MPRGGDEDMGDEARGGEDAGRGDVFFKTEGWIRCGWGVIGTDEVLG